MINFPDAPTLGQTFTSGSVSWVWDGVKWAATTSTSVLGDPVTILHGGTSATTAAAARTNLGAAPLVSPVFTGDPQAPTPASNDNDTSLATTAFVKAQGYLTSIGGPYLPLTGGILSGALTINSGALSVVNNATIGTTLNVTGAITGGPGANLYNLQVGNVNSNGTWTTNAGGVAINAAAGGIHSAGNITIDSGGITAGGNSSFGNATIGGTLSVGATSTLVTVNASGHITCSGYFMGPSGRPILYDPSGTTIQLDLTYGGLTFPIYNGTRDTYHFASGIVKWLQYVTSGGPSGWQLNGYDDSNNLYGILVDGLSDERLKQNIQDTQVDALAALLEIPIRSFEWTQDYMAHWASTGAFLTDDEKAANRAAAAPLPVPIGLVAQEVQAIIDMAVYMVGGPQPDESPIPDDALTINNPMLMPYVIRAIQQLASRMDAAGV